MLELTRFAHVPEGTLGKLTFPTGLVLYTIERPWKGNEPFVSCIPCGEYALEWDTTGRIQNVPRLRDTEPRSQINIHAANYPSQLHGCIAPGLDYTLKPMVTQSKKAMKLLMEQLGLSGRLADGDTLYWQGLPLKLRIMDFRSG